jgi:myo-inositol-1(or 4)-monophosphatase
MTNQSRGTPGLTDQGVPSTNALLLTVARMAARAAADVIRDAAPRVGSITWQEKSATDFLSEVDLAAEAAIRNVLKARLPTATLLAEESAESFDLATLGEGVVFIADPLDGTTNFLHGFPEYAVSIGVLSEGTLVSGIIIDVPANEEFTAVLGKGAVLNGKEIRVSSIETPTRALIGTGFPFKNPDDIAPYQAQMSRVMAGVSGVRRPGAAALDLASVACGRFDAFWENMLAPWDLAAGTLIVREAGGIVTDLAGAPARPGHTSIVAGNPAMHRWLLDTLHA